MSLDVAVGKHAFVYLCLELLRDNRPQQEKSSAPILPASHFGDN